MDTHVLEQLRKRTPAIIRRWETLLRIEPAVSPLANPEALKLLIPESIAAVFTKLGAAPRESLTLRSESSHRVPACDCGQNPYLAYFVAGEQAFVESIVLLQSELRPELRSESDVAEVIRSVRRMAADEIDTFCDICALRGTAEKCRHVAAAR